MLDSDKGACLQQVVPNLDHVAVAVGDGGQGAIALVHLSIHRDTLKLDLNCRQVNSSPAAHSLLWQ